MLGGGASKRLRRRSVHPHLTTREADVGPPPETDESFTTGPMRHTHTPLILGAVLLGACSADSTIPPGATPGRSQAAGRISLAVSIDSSRTQTLSGVTYTKKEFAQGNLAFDLATVQGARGQEFAWHDTYYGGFASWYEEFTQPDTYQIPGTTNYANCTRVDSTSYSFSSAASGPQPGNVYLNIFSDGTYRISIDASANGIITENYVTSNDCSGHVIRTASPPNQSPGVLFAAYFSSNTLGAGGYREYVTGTIPPGSNRVNGVLQWIDEQSVEVFSSGTTRITVPVHVTLTWDITLQ